MHDPKAHHPVAWVLDEAQDRHHVLDVGGVEEFQSAELHIGDVSPGQLDFERAAMAGGPEKHRLLLQGRSRFASLQHLFDDVAGLVGLAAHGHQAWRVVGLAFGPEILGEAFGGQFDDGIGGAEDRLARSIIALQAQHGGRRREVTGEVEDVAYGRRAKGVDRLGVVAHHGQAAAVGLQRQQDRCLQPVGVLVFVHQDVVESSTDLGGDMRIGDGLGPIEKQVVVIEHALLLLGLDVAGEQRP